MFEASKNNKCMYCCCSCSCCCCAVLWGSLFVFDVSGVCFFFVFCFCVLFFMCVLLFLVLSFVALFCFAVWIFVFDYWWFIKARNLIHNRF